MDNHDDIEFLHRLSEKRRPFIYKAIFLALICVVTAGSLVGLGSRISARDKETLTENGENGSGTLFNRVRNFVLAGDRTVEGFKEDRVNILLLGVGGEGHDGAQLSDTIILASIKPSTKQITLLSIPRDLSVDIPGYGVRKINAANAFGEQTNPGEGGTLAAQVVSETLGTPIPYWIRIDFKAFEEIIDKLGGVTIDVDNSFTDMQFPDDNFGFQTVSFEAGRQHMKGKDALNFARSRHGNNNESNDFARSKRQQKLIAAMRTQLITRDNLKNPATLASVAQSLLTYTDTNINTVAFLGLLNQVPDLMSAPLTNFALTAESRGNGTLNEVINDYGYFLVPAAGDFAVISDFVAHIFEKKPEEPFTRIQPKMPTTRPPSSTIIILNGTWEAGLAATAEHRLTEHSIKVARIGNTLERTTEETVIYKIKKNAATTKTIERITPWLSAPVIETEPPVPVDPDVDILIILGKDHPVF